MRLGVEVVKLKIRMIRLSCWGGQIYGWIKRWGRDWRAAGSGNTGRVVTGHSVNEVGIKWGQCGLLAAIFNLLGALITSRV